MNPIFTFFKKIKDEKIVHHEIAELSDVIKIDKVIQKLEELPKVSMLRIDEIELRTNSRKWVNSLIAGYPDKVRKEEAEYLLSDFTDAMQTRMREESKYAIGLLLKNKIVLCHSISGEETITPEWKIIPRMLDTDNILRYVCFTDEKGLINVKFWEREASNSFIEWLGLPRKEAFLFGGKYRICCEIEGITTELQLTDKEMEQLVKAHSELKDGRIKFPNPIQILNVSEIRVGKKRYENTQDFMQDYEAEQYGIPHYQKEYERINKHVLPLIIKYYDEKNRVVSREGEEENIEIMKSTPKFDILFANENIEFRASYLKELAKRVVNGESMHIFHAGLKFKAPPFTIGNMNIYNKIQWDSLSNQIVNYYNKTNIKDRDLASLLQYAILEMLAEINNALPIVHFFKPLAKEVLNGIVLEGKWIQLESEFIEYKSRDFLAGENKEVTNKLRQDLETKLKISPCKIYFIGIEDDGTISSIPASRLKNDRVENIRSNLQNGLPFADIHILNIIQGDKGILMIIALLKSSISKNKPTTAL